VVTFSNSNIWRIRIILHWHISGVLSNLLKVIQFYCKSQNRYKILPSSPQNLNC